MHHRMTEKPYKGIGMEGFIAKWYASLTRNTLDEFKKLAARIASELPPPSRVLEVAPGPGYFAIELAKLGAYQISGLDISRTFVEIASKNAADAGIHVDFREGDAAHMPFPDGSFDFVLCRAAFKNFTRPVEALREMRRVLDVGGRALIIDLRRDASPESIERAVDGMHLGTLNALITRLTFRFMLLKRAYTRRELEQLAGETGFESRTIREDLIGLELSLER